MTPIKQAPLVEYVLTKATTPDCHGCAYSRGSGLPPLASCEESGDECSALGIDGGLRIWSIVPAGFSDEEVGHG